MFKSIVLITVCVLVGYVYAGMVCETANAYRETIHNCARECQCPRDRRECELTLNWYGKVRGSSPTDDFGDCQCKACYQSHPQPDNGRPPQEDCRKITYEPVSEQECASRCKCESGRACRGHYQWSAYRGACTCTLCSYPPRRPSYILGE